MIHFYLDFITSGHGIKEIEEPQGTDGVAFSIKQDDGRKGRDTISTEGSKYRITDKMNGYLDLILLNIKLKGHQAKIRVSIDYGDGIQILGLMNIQDVDTDGKTFIEFSIIQDSSESKIKETIEVPVDLFSATDLKGNPIIPCSKYKLFMPAKPYVRVSEWNNQPKLIQAQGSASFPSFFNPISNLVQYSVRESLTWLQEYSYSVTGNSNTYSTPPQNFKVIRAASNLKGGKAILKLKLKTVRNPNGVGGTLGVRGRFGKGRDGDSVQDFANNLAYSNPNVREFYTTPVLTASNPSYEVDATLTIDLPDLDRGEVLYFTFIHLGADNNSIIASDNTFGECDLQIIYTENAYNIVTDAVRYIDAIKYVALSTAGMQVNAPRFEYGGEFYDQFITNAQLMRGLNRPFYLSFKDILDKQLRPELNGDFQVTPNSEGMPQVFIGLRPDFYREVNIGTFLVRQYDTFRNLIINDRYACNKLNIAFTNYASQKESVAGNTLDIVHGESENYIPNDIVSNTREITIGIIRDPFLIQDMLDKIADSLKNTDTATQDDDKLVMVDAVNFTPAPITETSQLEHDAVYFVRLILRNDLSFSWVRLGLAVGSNFTILSGLNAGVFTVESFTDQTLTLYRQDSNQVILDGLDISTKYRYITTGVNLKMRTNEGFTIIRNLAEPNNFGNLRFTAARILRDYYNSEADTMLLNNPLPVKNTKYLYNRDAVTQYNNGTVITEGESWSPDTAILTQFKFSCELQLNIKEYFTLQDALKTQRGYIETYDQDGLIIQGYPTSLEWTGLIFGAETPEEFGGVMKGEFEERYNQFQVQITAEGISRIINGISYENGFTYRVDGLGYVRLMDHNGKKILPPVLYNRIRVNDSQAAVSAQEISGWLNMFAVR